MCPKPVPVCPHSVSLSVLQACASVPAQCESKCDPGLCHCAQLCTGSGDPNSELHAGVASILPLTDGAVCTVLSPSVLTHRRERWAWQLSQTAGCCCCTWLARCSIPSVSVKRGRNSGRKAGVVTIGSDKGLSTSPICIVLSECGG